MDLNGLHQLIGYLREDFKDFKKNDFRHLSERVDGLSKRVAWIVGIISGLTLVGNVLLRVL